MYFLYSALLASVLLIGSPYWLWRVRRSAGNLNALPERLGRVPARLAVTDKPAIWVHAVSVGEVLAGSRLVDDLRRQLPGYAIFVSTTTATGQTLARHRWGEESVFYCPIDLEFALRPYFQKLRPALLVIVETELWPNLLRMARGHESRVAMINARISDRSYPGYLCFRRSWQRVLDCVDAFLPQTEKDRDRLVSLGADSSRVTVAGNLKFDIGVPAVADVTRRIRKLIAADTPVTVCGSTMPGEEALALAAFDSILRRHDHAVLILAPRRPERFPEVARIAEAFIARRTDVSFLRRSLLNIDGSPPLRRAVFLLDSIGELPSIYSLATVAFVGGSLVNAGGHSMLEPAQFGIPVLVGPYTQNFREIVSLFRESGALCEVTRDSLASELCALLDSPAERDRMGTAARRVFESQAGAADRTLQILTALLRARDLLTPGAHDSSLTAVEVPRMRDESAGAQP